MKKLFYSTWLILLCLTQAFSQTKIYKTIDNQGNIEFSDMPIPGKKSRLIETSPTSKPSKKPKTSTSDNTKAINALNKRIDIQKKRLSLQNNQIAKAKSDLIRYEDQVQKCLSGRRVAVKDTTACHHLQGAKKTTCIAIQPVSYKLSTPENCQTNEKIRINKYLNKANEKKQEILNTIEKLQQELDALSN